MVKDGPYQYNSHVFKLQSEFKPTGDQPEAIIKLTEGLTNGLKDQVLLGVTGSGKTFTIAQVIAKINRPTLVISHNKTLAGQLFQEFRHFFPNNAVSYFVSYYDYYQPEAYIPQSDTYIEKETEINKEIDKLRLAATTNLLTRRDTIIVASVSCIYNIGSPREYGHFVLELAVGMKVETQQILSRLTDLQYERGEYDFQRGSFRLRSQAIDIFPAYLDEAVRIELSDNFISQIYFFEPLTGRKMPTAAPTENIVIYPAKHYMTDPSKQADVFKIIRQDLNTQVAWFEKNKQFLEAQRLKQKVKYDLEMIAELGYVNGIENYSRYFDGREPGDAPYTLLDYFREPYGEDWLLVIDESHMTIPQLNGMYTGDHSRKKTLIDFGFRLPAAYDNRPLKFDEFLKRKPQTIYVSATPADWELQKAGKKGLAEQLVRPTGLIDPEIIIKPSENQIKDLAIEIKKRVAKKQRVLVTTLTKQMAEDLAEYLQKKISGIKVAYLHSDIETLERQDILQDLRKGHYDCLVGINLLREGLDLPEVSLVAIIDADKEGFLRSRTALIQTMGRAARHVQGEVIMYADRITASMTAAIREVKRRRQIQLAYNKEHHLKPKGIIKPLREQLIENWQKNKKDSQPSLAELQKIEVQSLTPKETKALIQRFSQAMRQAARDLDFELAASLRDKVKQLTEENK